MRLLPDGETECPRPALTTNEHGVLALLSKKFKPDEKVVCRVCHACTTIVKVVQFRASATASGGTPHVVKPRRMGLEELVRHVNAK